MKQLPGKGMQSGDRVGCRMAAYSGTVIRIEPCMLFLETAEMSTAKIRKKTPFLRHLLPCLR